MKAQLSGSSSYYDEEDFSQRSDPPLLYEHHHTPQQIAQALAAQQAQAQAQVVASQNTAAAVANNNNDHSEQAKNNDAMNNMASPRANDYEQSQTNKDHQPKLSTTKPQKTSEDESSRLGTNNNEQTPTNKRSVTSAKDQNRLLQEQSGDNNNHFKSDQQLERVGKANDQKSSTEFRQSSPVFTGSNQKEENQTLTKGVVNSSDQQTWSRGKKQTESDAQQQLKEGDLTQLKVSDILQGNYAPLEIPLLDILGTYPLIYEEYETLIAEIDAKDEFFVDDIEEEFLMFTAEMQDREIRRQDGPHQTLRWRKKLRNFVPKEPKAVLEPVPEQEELRQLNINSVRNSIEGTELTRSAREEGFFMDETETQQSCFHGESTAAMLVLDTEENQIGSGLQAAPLTIGYEQNELELMASESVANQYVNDLIEKISAKVISPEPEKEEVDQQSVKETSQDEEKNEQKGEDIIVEVLHQSDNDNEGDEVDESDQGLELAILQPFYDTIDDAVIVREMIHPRIVQLQPLRPICESLEQLFIKEYESTWINEKQMYEDLAHKKLPVEEPTKKNKKKKNSQESKKEQDKVLAKEESFEEIAIDDNAIDSGSIGQDSGVADEEEIVDEDDDNNAMHNDSIESAVEDQFDQQSDQQIKSEAISDDDQIANQSIVVSNSVSMEKISVENEQEQLKHGESIDVIQQDSIDQDEDEIEVENERSSQEFIVEDNAEKQPTVQKQESSAEIKLEQKRDPVQKKKITGTQAAAVQSLKKRQPTDEEKEFAKMRESQQIKDSINKTVSNNKSQQSLQSSSTTYVKRPQIPKLMDKKKMQMRQSVGVELGLDTTKIVKNGAQKLKHPTQTDVTNINKANENAGDHELLPAKKKPRVPTVPDHLRASSKSPTPASLMRESVERASQASKKPRVPKVAEILPGAKIKVVQEVNENVNKKFNNSPQTTQKKAYGGKGGKHNNMNSLMAQTPSMANIHKSSVNLEVDNRSPRSPPPRHIGSSIYTPGGAKITSLKRREKKSQASRINKQQKLLTPTQIEDRYGNIRVIKPTREEAITRLNQHPDATSEIQSYATLPNGRLDSNSPESTHGNNNNHTTSKRHNTSTMPPLSYNKNLPYEQHLVAQLFEAYRREGNQPARTKIRDRHSPNFKQSRVQMPIIMGALDGDFEKQIFQDMNSIEAGKRQRSEAPFSTSAKSLMNNKHGGHYQIDTDLNQSILSGKLNLSRANIKDKLSSNGVIKGLGTKKHHYNNHANDSKKQLVINSPFSPSQYSAGLDKDGSRIEDQHLLQQHNSGFVSRVELHKNHISINSKDRMSNPQDSEGEDDFQQISRHTFNVNHQSSFQKLLKVNPSWVQTQGQRRSTFEGADKATIFQQLQQNSQAFLNKEKNHVQAFRKAQSIQKKNLDFMSSSSSVSLAPIKSKGHFTARAHSLAKPDQVKLRSNFLTANQQLDQQSSTNLPTVQADFFNTYAVLEEYGNQGVVHGGTNQYQSRQSTGSKHLIPIMHQTNQTDFKAKRYGKKPQQLLAPYPAFASNSGVSDAGRDYASNISAGGNAGVPAIASGRTRHDEIAKLASSNRSNFFPSFDSRGNVGIIEDSSEFTPQKSYNNKLHQTVKASREKTKDAPSARTTTQAAAPNAAYNKSQKQQTGLPSLQSGNSRAGSIKRPSIAAQASIVNQEEETDGV